MQNQDQMLGMSSHKSPTLSMLAELSDRPKDSLDILETQLAELHRPSIEIACVSCQMSLWQTTPKSLSCFCKVMFARTWDSSSKIQIVGCDGSKEREEADQ